MNKGFEIITGNSPLVAAAVHDGHYIREELRDYMNLLPNERMREEDPYTGYLTEVAPNRIIVNISRFEVDMNRPRDKAVYKQPSDAWGLHVWKKPLPQQLIEQSLAQYDRFYRDVRELLVQIIGQHGFFLLLDLHTYNYRRNPDAEDNAEDSPAINIGTESLPRKWHAAKDQFMRQLASKPINGEPPDVRENVRFKGGEFSRWVNSNFGAFGFALAIEFKKVFMDEWTGRVDIHHLENIKVALTEAIRAVQGQAQRIAT
ncbi:MAG: N-formylglutamate amidohydrolase [Bacteroidota bacterium]|jgi:N-formylglutamate deformylase|nr:MAG: N-formylglutamate amidohydrolase [Bacteroidota bacterium]